MNIKTKKYEVTELYVEDKSYKVVSSFISEKRKEGFIATSPKTHYGEHGDEGEKMWWSKLTKETDVE
ncbi:hypothetical protein PF046_19105 [Bacillus amyloliquefaciens]|uniref:hypothetical protein n=1 Tax=Bacillus amyloliquefaciens group TaxID=1938374 RepID=UPI002E201B72|nr:hypothetical protein [Bacillus velezensis]